MNEIVETMGINLTANVCIRHRRHPEPGKIEPLPGIKRMAHFTPPF